MADESNRRYGLKGKNLLWGFGALILGAFLWFVGMPCPLFEMTGIYCPGCGATRAVKALAHGNVLLALHDNLWLFLFVIPALSLSAATSIWPLSERHRGWIKRYLWVTAYAAAVFVILRNIHVAPFNWLAPLD